MRLLTSLRFSLAASLILLTFQTIASGQMIVAHRGSSYTAPENTLAAFRLAWQQDSDGIEGDFYLTADKQIVCIHDTDTQRTGGRFKEVESSTLKELRELEYGSWKSEEFAGEPIPTFKQVLETVPRGKTFVIELKSKSQIVPVLLEQLRQRPTDDIEIMVITFDQATAAAVKQQLPETKVHWLTSFKQDSETGAVRPTAQQIAATVKALGVDGVGMKGERAIVDDQFIDTVQAAGCPEYHVWTIDDIDDARFFQQQGAMGITTNKPDIIKAALMPAAINP